MEPGKLVRAVADILAGSLNFGLSTQSRAKNRSDTRNFAGNDIPILVSEMGKVPVVVLTTSGEEQDRMESYNFAIADYVIKPLFSREGANIEIVKNGQRLVKTPGPYESSQNIVQQYHRLPKFGQSHTLIGSWLVNDKAAGISIREDSSLVTQDMARYIPHVILD